jgi:excisionase family DNA binding protein
MPETWLTKQGAADHAKVSTDAITAAVKAGDLPAYKVGQGKRDYRLTAREVDEWMLSRTYEPPTAS